MSKRKRETTDEGLASSERKRENKKQRTSTTTSKAALKHSENEESAQLQIDRKQKNLARKLAKRERKAQGIQQRNESGRKDGIETGKHNGDTRLVKLQEKRLLKKEPTELSKTRHGNQELGKRDGPKLREKHKSKKKKRKEKNGPSSVKESKKEAAETATWKVSDPAGGQMLDVDPVFSLDEKFLLVAYRNSVAVYSTSTSLLVRHLRIDTADSVSAFAFSSTTQGHLYLSTISGTIEKWDWVEGSRLGRWRTSSSIYSLMTAKHNTPNPKCDLVYTINRKAQGPWLISVHRLAGHGAGAETDVKTLFTNQHALSSINILERGRMIAATSGSELILGSSDEPAPSSFDEVQYTWRVIECPEHIVSMDLRVRPSEGVQKSFKGGRSSPDAIDIAVGGLKGSIHIYEDLLRKIIRRDHSASKGNLADITSRRLHWHRNAVHAVKWSADGNYVISGGQETTLVLWQLETAKRQHLPHLGAAIESIVVSPFGASYGIRLADNSAMVLSTTELRPTFSIAGIQLPAVQQARIPLPIVPTVTLTPPRKGAVQRSRFPACVSSSDPGRLLLAVPPATTSKQFSITPSSASYLQTIDVGAAHQISRQALTRTKVTTLNMGPESNIIEEPAVTHIQTSSDGQWLASVDAWMPPKRDLEPFTFDQDGVLEELNFHEEVFLKFWSWNADTKVWELVSRTDDPHAPRSGHAYDHGGVLDLVSDPSSVAFATIGGDRIVKTWKPVIRRRNGLEVKSKDGKGLRSWHCQHATSLEMSELPTTNGLLGARLAYSQDGSILAAGLQSSMASPIHIIDTRSGEIKSVHTGLYAGPLLGLGIAHRYIVTLSDELCVYDLVNDTLKYGIDLPAHGLSPAKRLDWSHLVVNTHDSLFAVTVPQNSKTGLESQVVVFDPSNATPQFITRIPSAVTTLLSMSERKGFYAIDSAAQMRTLRPGQSKPSVPMMLPEDSEAPTRGLTDLFGGGQRALTQGDRNKDVGLTRAKFGSVIDKPDMDKGGAAVVSQDRLAEVFDMGPSHALPPVTQLFEQVAKLYFGKEEA